MRIIERQRHKAAQREDRSDASESRHLWASPGAARQENTSLSGAVWQASRAPVPAALPSSHPHAPPLLHPTLIRSPASDGEAMFSLNSWQAAPHPHTHRTPTPTPTPQPPPSHSSIHPSLSRRVRCARRPGGQIWPNIHRAAAISRQRVWAHARLSGWRAHGSVVQERQGGCFSCV
jgi:hypothetical protein